MKRKYIILIVAFLMICTCSIPVSAATGSIRLSLPEEMEGKEVSYFSDDMEQSVKVQEGGAVVIENLSPGDYKIQIPDSKEFEFSDVEVRVPTWSEEEERMLYDITVEPKYQKISRTPKTGDEAPIVFYVAFCGAGLVAVALSIWMARKRKMEK